MVCAVPTDGAMKTALSEETLRQGSITALPGGRSAKRTLMRILFVSFAGSKGD